MLEEVQTAPKVFISYSWDCPEHKDRVLLLANSLKKYGIDSKIDRYQQAPPEGWYRWMMNQIDESDFVLIVCTEKYNLRYRNKEEQGQGRGVTWEGGLIIEDLYNGQGINDKYIPILFYPNGEKYIPRSLQTYAAYRLFDKQYDAKISGEFQNLYRHLTKQPEYEEPKLGKRITLPPIQPAQSNVDIHGGIVKDDDLDNTQRDSKQQQAEQPITAPELMTSDRPINYAPRPFTRRQVLRWAVPGGIGLVGVTVAGQFLGHQSPQSPPADSLITPSTPPAPPPFTSPRQTPSGIDYSKLEELLTAGKWMDADQETTALMLKVAHREKEGWIQDSNFKTFPCEILSKLDRLWVHASNGKFGLSVQKKIYMGICGANSDGEYNKTAWQCFGDQVGWRVPATFWKSGEVASENEWVSYSNLTFSTKAPKGHLPARQFRIPSNYQGGYNPQGDDGGYWLAALSKTCLG